MAGSAGCVARLLLCTEPPDLDSGEITDKGYINQGVVLDRRAEDVERLYADEPDAAIIRPSPSERPD
jgi:feruloyl-CoA synthase